ncbi:sensor histidine kinase [Sediminispirochaeta smaragdinae]|uniref:histidine kinase n=1 Tax=Sediminispirochaeta smaragdinae (strain DSM 11293 / JCM 15392 / SEBR 4228) TaxID=573413 RepID=E1R7M1_SEDSS|nr:histidine kinase dimerization/phosphoacceptor domain -containing protein [Sediminispirochaeta smaragdinae]ADK82726.1 signal transduction histidine kinase [Sediminispirochaeta smaragdinae DSM 11293]
MSRHPDSERRRHVIMFAVADRAEQEAFHQLIKKDNLPYTLLFPESVSNVEELSKTHDVDIIVTDLKFQNGGFADWLILWPQPFILLFDFIDHNMVDEMVSNETSDFLIRDKEGTYLTTLPHRIRKILNYKESMDRHNIHLQATERRYLDLVQALPDIIYSLDDRGMFNFVNDAVRAIGYEPYELLGKHFSSILDPADIPRVSRETVLPRYTGKKTGDVGAPKLFDERRTGERKTAGLEVRVIPGPHLPDRQKQMIGAVIAYGEVSAVGFSNTMLEGGFGSVGIIRDITTRKEHENLLRKSLAEKEVLLKEIHHRVKNNLQIISSLLSLQSNYFENDNDYRLYLDTQMQVQSMALVHEQLYLSENLSRIDMTQYFNRLCDALFDIYRQTDHVSYHITATEVFLRPEVATPLALLTAELISNSLKHAFPKDRHGRIEITLKEREKLSYTLTVKDNGIGMNNKEQQKGTETTGLGLLLIRNLTEQLKGTIEELDTPGTGFRINFSTALE